MDTQRILGVDPGSVRLGYGILEGSASRPRHVASGVLAVPERWEPSRRLGTLQRELVALLEAHHPDCVAVESTFHGRNVRALVRLAEARGVVLGVAGARDLPVFDYSPAVVKKAVTGRGNARKETVALVVRSLIPELQGPDTLDVTDAVAVAICHLHRSRLVGLTRGAGRRA